MFPYNRIVVLRVCLCGGTVLSYLVSIEGACVEVLSCLVLVLRGSVTTC